MLSKARMRWGGEVFEKHFVRTVAQCVEAGLVDGSCVTIRGGSATGSFDPSANPSGRCYTVACHTDRANFRSRRGTQNACVVAGN